MRRAFFAAALAAIALLGSFSISMAADPVTQYRTVTVGDVKVFYREAGDPKKPALLLLHGFPTSSHMFRNLDSAAGGPLSRHRPRSIRGSASPMRRTGHSSTTRSSISPR